MATDTQTHAEGFGRVSRVRGLLFEYLSFGASLLGIAALATLLVYVAIDAFDLVNASPEWLLTYFLTLVVPYLAFCLYAVGDREITRQTAVALLGGLVAVALAFSAVETFIRPIPRLTWQLTYLFVVVVPLTGYLTFLLGSRPSGAVGFGLLGRMAAGTALGLALGILFLVFDPRLWFLAFVLGVVPAVSLYGAGRFRDIDIAASAALPVGVVGLLSAVFLRGVVRTYPTTLGIYAITLAVPIAVAGAVVVARRSDARIATVTVGVPLAVAVAGSLLAGRVGVAPSQALLVLVVAGVTTATFLQRALTRETGRTGLLLPIVLVGGTLVGALLVQSFGFPTPDPWLDYAYVTNPPSRTPANAGLYPAIVGSVIIIALVAVLSFVLGVGTAVFLEEYTAGSGFVGSITRLIQVNIANLAAVPSVVYGMLGLGLFANLLGFGFGTAVTASLTLSLLILPITIISAQEAIRAVPDDLRRGSDAMGATRWQTTKNVVLPEALPGILTGTILALGRAIGETAPLIMIGAATTVFSAPTSLWSKFSAMPMQIYAWSDFPQADFRYGVVAAGVMALLIILLGMNATAIVLRNRSERGA